MLSPGTAAQSDTPYHSLGMRVASRGAAKVVQVPLSSLNRALQCSVPGSREALTRVRAGLCVYCSPAPAGEAAWGAQGCAVAQAEGSAQLQQ